MTPVELVREAYALLGAGDTDRFAALIDDRFVIEQTEQVPWGGRTQGREAALAFFDNMHRYIDSLATPAEYLESGEFVVAIARSRGVARRTGKSFDVRVVHVWETSDDRLIAFRPFVDVGRLRAALN